jgi:ABC-2 type transport system ATP-binding protein
MSALQVEGVSFAYGQRQALQDVSLSVAAGSFSALLGPNGAGKSTLIALLTRLYDLQQGDIHIFGHSLRSAPHQALRQLGVVFQQSTLDLDLSVQQNLAYHAALHGLSKREELARQQLDDRRHEKVRALNGGHRRRVEIARALLHHPRLLLLDEASAGLDPASRLALNQHVRQLCHEHEMAVLWTTHLLDEVEHHDELLILNRSRLVAQGGVAQISRADADLATSFARLTGDAEQSHTNGRGFSRDAGNTEASTAEPNRHAAKSSMLKQEPRP